MLFIADGWDELDDSQRREDSVLYELLFGGLFPFVSVLLTSRPSASENLRCHFDRFVEVHGFNLDNIRLCIQSEVTSHSNHEENDHLLEKLKNNTQLESLCSVPLLFAIVCHLWHTLKETFLRQ